MWQKYVHPIWAYSALVTWETREIEDDHMTIVSVQILQFGYRVYRVYIKFLTYSENIHTFMHATYSTSYNTEAYELRMQRSLDHYNVCIHTLTGTVY